MRSSTMTGTEVVREAPARQRRARLLAGALVVIVVSVAFFVETGSTAPRRLPRTLADNQPATEGVVEPSFPVDFVAATWSGDEGHADVRFRHGRRWTDWQEMGHDGAQAEGTFGTNLVAGGDADAYQVRGVPTHGRLIAINTTDGPPETVGTRRRGAAGASTPCRSRADWGADESLMTWTPGFQPVQVLTVHHTDTTNGDTDPAATVRAIYRYHAVDRDWGDIGYQYLVDQEGIVYEGRSSGTTTRSCVNDAGHGSDFGHTEDGTDRGVVGAHTGGWNSGNLGIALLGNYNTTSPPEAQLGALVDVLGDLSLRHGIDPRVTDHTFVNPANGATKVVPTVSGHRDWVATECPGAALYADLPDIRTDVAAISHPGGDWVGIYGTDGHALGGWNATSDLVDLPATITLEEGGRVRWSASTTEERALESPDGTTRRAAAWTSATELRLRLTFTKLYTGTLHLYAVDWTAADRRQRITVTNRGLDSVTEDRYAFTNGRWAHVPVKVQSGGSIMVTVTPTTGHDAILSGLFLGDAPVTDPYPEKPLGGGSR